MNPLLSILVPTMESRRASRERLLAILRAQGGGVELLVDDGPGSIGAKRERMLKAAHGDYVAFIDDDDMVAEDYVERVLAACAQGADCCSLEGVVFRDGKPPKKFQHSIRCPGWGENSDLYYRTPNHLNAVRRDLALKAGFPDAAKGEDHEFSKRLRPLLSSEVEIHGTLYYYLAGPKLRERLANPRILVKWPTRGRPDLFQRTMIAHTATLSGRVPVQYLVSVDEDDSTRGDIVDIMKMAGLPYEVVVGPAGRTKIQAINADIAGHDFDVIVGVADDMIPEVPAWDERIIADFARSFPDLSGLLVYDDGFQGTPADPNEIQVAVMPVMGRRLYDRLGHVYHPEYASLWCDNELTDVAVRMGRARRIPRVIIRHEWMGAKGRRDALLERNESHYKADEAVYRRRKALGFPRGSSLSYSQNDEESVILTEVGDKPRRLLDVGAYNGKTLSNTLRLIEQGWSAVLVEPAPGPFGQLVELHRGNQNVVLVNAAVSAKGGLVEFRDSRGDAVSTLRREHADLWSRAGVQWDGYLVNAVRPKDLLARVGLDFAFVNIDVEGMNREVFDAFPWTTLASQGLRLVCVEHEGNKQAMEDVLRPLGFERFHENAENVMFRRRG